MWDFRRIPEGKWHRRLTMWRRARPPARRWRSCTTPAGWPSSTAAALRTADIPGAHASLSQRFLLNLFIASFWARMLTLVVDQCNLVTTSVIEMLAEQSVGLLVLSISQPASFVCCILCAVQSGQSQDDPERPAFGSCSPTEEQSADGRGTSSSRPPSEAGSAAAGLDGVVARMRELATNRGDGLRRSKRDRGTLRSTFRDLVGVVEVRQLCTLGCPDRCQ